MSLVDFLGEMLEIKILTPTENADIVYDIEELAISNHTPRGVRLFYKTICKPSANHLQTICKPSAKSLTSDRS